LLQTTKKLPKHSHVLGQHDYRPHYWFVPKRIDVDWAKSKKNTFSQMNQGFELGQRVLKQLLELAKDQKTRKIKPKKITQSKLLWNSSDASLPSLFHNQTPIFVKHL